MEIYLTEHNKNGIQASAFLSLGHVIENFEGSRTWDSIYGFTNSEYLYYNPKPNILFPFEKKKDVS